MKEKDFVLEFVRTFRSRNGEVSDVQKIDKLGRQTFRARVLYDQNKRENTGICKFYSNGDGKGWEFAAAKQLLTLLTLEKQETSSGSVLDVDYYEEKGEERIVILRTEILGKTVREETEAVPLPEVRKLSAKLFDQMCVVSGDRALVGIGMGYCGDLSAGNVVIAPDGYTVIEWDSQLGQAEMSDITRRYVALEVMNENGEIISQVLADTYSLGCLLARALMGQLEFRKIDEFISFSLIRDMIPEETHEFFEKVLAENPEERTFIDENDPCEHYLRLGRLFGINS